jgi:outer membrane protein insertion porin family
MRRSIDTCTAEMGIAAFLIMLFLVLMIFASVAFADGTLEIKKIEVVGLQSISKDELLYLLDLQKGAVLDPASLRLGIKRAFLKGIFKDIIVESPGPDDSVVTVTVQEKSIIKSIDIHGNNHFSNRFIRNNFSIKKGERINERKLANSVVALDDLIRKKGFPDCKVTYSLSEPQRNDVVITIAVEEGEPLMVRGIKIFGGLEEDKESVSKRLKLSVGDVFDRTSVDQGIEKIKSDYKNRDHIGTKFDYTFENGALDIRFDPGNKMTVEFEGNSTIGSRFLKKEIPFYELNEFSDDLLEETVVRIIGLYHGEGFPDAQIAPVVTASDRNIIVKFYIHEGDRYRIDKIDFEGASIPLDKLKNIIQLQTGGYYNPDMVSPDSDSLREFYRSLGYLYANVQEPEVETKDNKAAITFRITEGMQVKISSINIKNNNSISADAILRGIPLKNGNPYNEIDIFDSRIKIQNLYRNKGFLSAIVTIEREISNEQAAITFNVQEGSELFFGKSVVIGNNDTRREVILRSLLHKEKEPFNYSLLMGERQRLYRTGRFTDVEAVPWQIIDHTRDILYKLDEGNAGAVEFGVGYGEYEKFRGFIDIGYKNLFGMNRQLSFRTEMSTLNRRYILQYFEPWFLNREIGFRAQILHEYKKELNIDTREINYRLTRETATAGVEKKLSDRVKGEIYYELDNVRTYDVKPDIVLTHEDVGTLLISGVKAALIYDSRDNPVNPRKGILGGITYKVATSLLFSETDFNKIQMYANKYLALSKNIILAVSLRGGVAKGFNNTTELPLVERFFLGGRTTVRGYSQDTLGPKGSDNNPTGGNAFLMGNLEFRFDIWKGFGLVTFFDGGNVWQKAAQVTLGDIKYTTGLGLRYNTPVGPISIDYGYKLNRGQGESRGEIHFSVGQSF